MIKAQLVTLGARIPADLKRKVSDYCDRNGIKLQFFVTEAIKDKLSEIVQDEFDNTVIDERMKDPRFTSATELAKYVESRKKHG